MADPPLNTLPTRHLREAVRNGYRMGVEGGRSQQRLTSAHIDRLAAKVFLRDRRVCPIQIREMGGEASQGGAYEGVAIGCAPSFDEEDGAGGIFVCEATGENGTGDTTANDYVMVLNCGHDGYWS